MQIIPHTYLLTQCAYTVSWVAPTAKIIDKLKVLGLTFSLSRHHQSLWQRDAVWWLRVQNYSGSLQCRWVRCNKYAQFSKPHPSIPKLASVQCMTIYAKMRDHIMGPFRLQICRKVKFNPFHKRQQFHSRKQPSLIYYPRLHVISFVAPPDSWYMFTNS